jgi:polar amino acid transport system substrate-binding protein
MGRHGKRSTLERFARNMKRILLTVAAFFILTGTGQGESISYRFWAGEIPPYSFVDHAQRAQGDLYRVFQALVKRMGYGKQVEIIPWKRVLMETQKNHPIIFIPLARSPERETHYQWIGPLILESFGIFGIVGHNQGIHDKASIRKLRICTLRGSATEALALRHELRQVEIVATNDTCARLLKAGRVDAWLAAKRAALASFAQVGYDVKELKEGVELDHWPLYLAASKSVPPAEIQRWRQELQKMKSDGSFDRLMH